MITKAIPLVIRRSDAFKDCGTLTLELALKGFPILRSIDRKTLAEVRKIAAEMAEEIGAQVEDLTL